MSETSARAGALAKLAEEAARFTAVPSDGPTMPPRRPSRDDRPAPHITSLSPPHSPRVATDDVPVGPPGYVPVAVAPERGNTRPVVPVDGRLHMRMAQPTLDALDDVVRSWRSSDPVSLRDLERATLVRIGIAMLLADVAENGRSGAVGEAVRAALDPTQRHTDRPLPQLSRWLRNAPQASQELDQQPSVRHLAGGVSD